MRAPHDRVRDEQCHRYATRDAEQNRAAVQIAGAVNARTGE